MSFRLLGLLLTAVAAILGYFAIYTPILDAQSGAANVSYSIKIVFMLPMVAIFGILILLLGRGPFYREPDGMNVSVFGWLVFGISLAAGAASYYYFTSYMEALGYR